MRSLPGSRHCPQFNGEELAASLAAAGIDYQHMTGLGGRRHTRKDSANVGWRNASFRGYADDMQTPEFEFNLAELIRLGSERRVVIMCAEAVPWRCHRSLIGDARSGARRDRRRHLLHRQNQAAHADAVRQSRRRDGLLPGGIGETGLRSASIPGR